MPSLQLRTATKSEYEAVMRLVKRSFGEEYTPDETGTAEGIFEPDRNLIFTDGDQIVANAAAETRELTVPGAVVPAVHVTLVGVHPTYRRRGLLTRLMHRQLREAREGGTEPLAVLWASEGRIYQRFGYALASRRLHLTADRRNLRLLPRFAAAPAAGRLREALPKDVVAELKALFERLRPERVGWSSRPEPFWAHLYADRPGERDGATPWYALLYEDASGLTGFARWRVRANWDNGPAGGVAVAELMAATPAAYTELWRFLLSVDLSSTVDLWAASWDEPIMHMVDEPRALNGRFADALWLRIVDLPAALRARRYLTPLDVVLEVDDAVLPENAGRWRLRSTGPDGPVSCVPADGDADLVCDIADLAAAYLGGTSLASLAAAGRVREVRPGALAEAGTAWGWHRAPGATEAF